MVWLPKKVTKPQTIKDMKEEFLKTLSSRNILNIDNSVNSNDKIITLSTCTDDNAGRKVIHAKLVTVLDN